MGYSFHILRQSNDGNEIPITLDEWNVYIDSDPHLKRPEPGKPNYSDTLAVLSSESNGSENWPWIDWCSGSISSDYPQLPMLKKMRAIAQHFGAIVMSDDGDILIIDEDGRVRIQPT